MSSSKMNIAAYVTLHEMIDIHVPDEIDKSSSVLVNHCKFVRANYLVLAADPKIYRIYH